jgi:polysaccharide biosynthesis/export protein
MNTRTALFTAVVFLTSLSLGRATAQTAPAGGQKAAPSKAAPPKPGTPTGSGPAPAIDPSTAAVAPPGYIIGPDDVLTIVFWRDKDLSGDVIVRPDGMISLPLINEVLAAGQTPDQLRLKLVDLASKYIEDPNAVVVVKQINSRKVFITGMVNKIGTYSLTAPTTVLQLITMAGGLQDFADKENIVVVRMENGRPTSYGFNYKDVIKRRKLTQNILLQPGDTVVVP